MKVCFDCSSGVSGDMLVGALLDAGADEKYLKKCLDSLKLDDFEVKIKKIEKNGFFATDFDVILKEDCHDHDLNLLYGEGEFPKIKVERNLTAVKNIIEKSNLSKNAKNISKKIFEIVALAESKAHKIEINKVVFHENGAMDSIIDIVSFAVCLDRFNGAEFFAINLCEGQGEINTRVGKLPIPTPAVKNIVDEFGLTLKTLSLPYELVTPTGIACLCAVAKFDLNNEEFKNKKAKVIGFGNGKRKYNLPCVLKVEIY